MMSSLLQSTILVSLAFLTAAAQDVRAVLVNRIDEDRQTVGIVAGCIGPNGREVVSCGSTAKNRAQKPDGDTIFEIGSITKVFTSLLLADMIERGEVKVDDPVAKFLPELQVPSRGGRQITLLDLSMHMSGLGSPRGMRFDRSARCPDRDLARLQAFLSSVPPAREPGEKYEYSNEGVGLLGRALARRTGLKYEDLVWTRILQPLQMTSSAITLSNEQMTRLARGYDDRSRPAPSFNTDEIPAAGALRSTANDMLKFLAANLELSDTPLKAAMRRMRSVRRPTGVHDTDIAMAWHISKKFGADVFWHSGGTFGYRSWVGFDPVTKKSAVVLWNSHANLDDIGFHLVDNRYPLVGQQAKPRPASAESQKRR